ncbi:bifunctional hydroxymethylpyrimidine kinase/phosphomethylpyrimidine kinase [Campylobacter sp. FMV-PI01]|uniref:hydroxymethylpyrimidine kinase n=1 Tax=Campylobacter portucalensis TaxID=2608384 RepID=A0A6L5WFN7_9BACT|nr:bifunctional hydroxymethylpyrimidine kinase/phosphomethylpyrimidine kinase [Campylobacter portucalensis]MSN95900.1 bifunctional hydroxymethylpyrimidine kinase/phosphomethylpyrimidine kinase [Campylobacter portucalensis]
MKVVLSIAGSDSSGGAGIQADIKTAEYFGVFCATAVTALTAQNTCGVNEIYEVDEKFIEAQLKSIISDFEISAIKIGMLSNKKIIDVVSEFLSKINCQVVLDPVFISKAGSPLMSNENINYLKKLFKFATILTPNLYEAKSLFGDDLEILAPCDVVVKNIKKSNFSIDKIYYKNGLIKEFKSKFINSSNLHGTGCSFAMAITANLALGKSLEDAIKISKNYIYKAIINAPNLGNGKGPIRHNLNRI